MASYRIPHLFFFLLLMFMLLVVLVGVNANSNPYPFRKTHSSLDAQNVNRTGRDVLEDISSNIQFEYMFGISRPDFYRYYLWEYYKGSSISERPKAVKQISQTYTSMALMDNTIDLVGLILFGPEKGHSILRSPAYHQPDLSVHEGQCLDSTPKLFQKYCGLPSENHLRHMQSFENMCRFVLDKADIKEALMIACGMENIDPSVIDVGNPSINVIPAPMHGSSQFCERVSIPGISRMNLQNFAKAYRLELLAHVPFYEEYKNIQICFHRDASLRLCECEDRDWISIQNPLRSSLMSPYEQSFVDVKFSEGVSGSVTVHLDEVTQVFRYEFFVSGICFLLLAPSFSKNLLNERVEQHAKWVMRVIAVQLLFMSSIDTLMAMVAVLFSLALNYVIICINAPVLFEKTKLWLCRTTKVGKDEDSDRGSTPKVIIPQLEIPYLDVWILRTENKRKASSKRQGGARKI